MHQHIKDIRKHWVAISVFLILSLTVIYLISDSFGNFTATSTVSVNNQIKNPSFEDVSNEDNSNNWVVITTDPGLVKLPSTDWKTDGIRSLEIRGTHMKNPTNTNLGVDIYQILKYDGKGSAIIADLNVKSPIKDGNIYIYLCWSYSITDAQINPRSLPDLQRCQQAILSTSSGIIESGYRQLSVAIPESFKGKILRLQLSSVSFATDTDNFWDYNWDNIRIV